MQRLTSESQHLPRKCSPEPTLRHGLSLILCHMGFPSKRGRVIPRNKSKQNAVSQSFLFYVYCSLVQTVNIYGYQKKSKNPPTRNEIFVDRRLDGWAYRLEYFSCWFWRIGVCCWCKKTSIIEFNSGPTDPQLHISTSTTIWHYIYALQLLPRRSYVALNVHVTDPLSRQCRLYSSALDSVPGYSVMQQRDSNYNITSAEYYLFIRRLHLQSYGLRLL